MKTLFAQSWVGILILMSLCILVMPLLAAMTVGAESSRGQGEITQGRSLYRSYCTSCHGANGRGDGPLAESINLKPSDLTKIRKNGGFSFDRISSYIDGRQVSRMGSMPIWGSTFDGSEEAIKAKIDKLTAYVESIQD